VTKERKEKEKDRKETEEKWKKKRETREKVEGGAKGEKKEGRGIGSGG